MPDPAAMEAAVHEYVAAFDAGDAERVAALFASQAQVEDPVGSVPQVGHSAILAFFKAGMATGAKLTLEGPVRISSDYAAFAFSVRFWADDLPMRVDVIDTFRFDAANKIMEMRAYFGPGNLHNMT